MVVKKTVKLDADVHNRLTKFKYWLQAESGEFVSMSDAIEELLREYPLSF